MLKEVLKILENDSRISVKEIATMLSTSPAEITRLIKEAETNRTILKYKAIINWDKVESKQVWALIEVKVTPAPEAGFDPAAERIATFPQVDSVYLASGNYDLLVIVSGKTEHEIGDFVSQKLSHIPGVQSTVTHFVMKRYKEDGEVLDGQATQSRQPMVL
ncbi:MAG: Lrp/AsnC family transcriptional regulator [Dehalococcoidales bacterium]|nr:Lrp/AsnC family transcriptional regulator [Dehalococcoidales bacterium]